MKNWPFCDVLTTAEHFAQVLVQKHTMNCQLGGRCQHVSLGCRYHADVQTKVQGSAGRQDSGQLWREANMTVHRTYEILRWGAGPVDVIQNKSDLGCKASFDQTELIFIAPTLQKP